MTAEAFGAFLSTVMGRLDRPIPTGQALPLPWAPDQVRGKTVVFPPSCAGLDPAPIMGAFAHWRPSLIGLLRAALH
jgi:hypothetical protein